MLDFSRFNVVSFDCYGTLIDWEAGILAAVRPVLRRHHVDRDDREILETFAALEAKHEDGEFLPYRLVLRFVMTEMSLRFRFDASPSELDSLSESVADWAPFPDTVAALWKIRQTHKLAVISNVDDALFQHSERRIGVPFDWVITAQQAGSYKPSPQTFEFALKKIGQPRERVLHVAQSVYHDIVPARRMGLATVWVNRRVGKPGSGATMAAEGEPDVEVFDLKSLADSIGR